MISRNGVSGETISIRFDSVRTWEITLSTSVASMASFSGQYDRITFTRSPSFLNADVFNCLPFAFTVLHGCFCYGFPPLYLLSPLTSAVCPLSSEFFLLDSIFWFFGFTWVFINPLGFLGFILGYARFRRGVLPFFRSRGFFLLWLHTLKKNHPHSS